MASKDVRRGKDLERDVARMFGYERRGNTGEGGSDSEEACPIAFECKSGYGKFALTAAWLAQASTQGDREEKPWALVQRPKGSRLTIASIDIRFLLELARQAGLTNTNHRTEETPNAEERSATT